MNGEVITVVGSGGKTTLFWRLAESYSASRRVLVTTTTKMLVPPGMTAAETPEPTAPACLVFAGRIDAATGKLLPLADGVLAKAAPRFDITLVEGDGSRGLPLKAWADWEPVVPTCTTVTVGVITLRPLGLPAADNLIHRLPLFETLTGARAGEPITLEHIALAITGERGKGLFSAARGKRVLYISQAETPEQLETARRLVRLLPPCFTETLECVAAGAHMLHDTRRINH